jgi:hypothetical protein
VGESQTIRVSVEEAATLLGIEKGSVKKRIQRGKLLSEKDSSGQVWVYLERSETVRDQSQRRSETDRDELVGELRDRVRFLEGQLESEREARTEERRRHDTLMAQLMQRLPAIEAPTEASGAPETAAEEPEGADPRPATGETQAATQPQQTQRPTEGVEHDTGALREWSGDVEGRRRPDSQAGGAQEDAQRPWWRRMFGG